MTPVFLNVMKDLEKDPKLKSLHFELFKMECTPKETQNFCTHEFNLDGFPTLYLYTFTRYNYSTCRYHQGKRVDEYLDGPDESKLLDWIKVSATKYPHIDTSNMVMQSSPTQATPQQIQNALHQKIQTANQMQQPPTPGTTSTVQGKVAGAHEDCDNPLDDTQPLTPTQQQKSSNPSSTPHPVPTDKVSFNKALIGYMVLFVSIILVVWILRLVQRRKRRTQMAYYRLGGYPASKQLEKDLDD